MMNAWATAILALGAVSSPASSAALLEPLRLIRERQLDAAVLQLGPLCPGSSEEVSRAADRGSVACKVLVLATAENVEPYGAAGFARSYWNLGDKAEKRRDYDLAEALFNVSIARDPKDPGAWHSLGVVHRERGRHQEALKAFEQSVQLDPTEPSTLYWLGTTQMDLGQLELAQKTMDRVLELDPQQSRVWFRRGEIHMLQNDCAAAIKDFEQAALNGVSRRAVRLKIRECESQLQSRGATPLLTTAEVIAFVGVTDAERAKAFYRDKLGLRLTSEEPSRALVFDAGGTTLLASLVEAVPPASYTVLGWMVENIGKAVDELMAKGISFERFQDFAQDDRGVWTGPDGTRVAWFKDPDGNMLSLTQSSAPPPANEE